MKKTIEYLKTSYLVTLLIYVATILFFLSAYITGKLNPFIFLNSDTFYLPALYKDLIINGNSMNGWHFSNASFLFPDFILYAIAHATFSNVGYAALFYTILQGACTTIVLYFLLFNCYIYNTNNQNGITTNKKYAARFAVLINTILTLFAVYESGDAGGNIYRTYQIAPWHFGACLMWLLGLLLLTNSFKQFNPDLFKSYLSFIRLSFQKNNKELTHNSNIATQHLKPFIISLFILGFIILLTVLSDKIYVIQFIIPAILCCLFMPIKSSKFVLFSILGGCILGYIFSLLLPLAPLNSNILANVTQLFDIQDQLFQSLDQYFTTNSWYNIILFLFGIIAIGLFICERKNGLLRFIFTFYIFTMIITWLATVLNGAPNIRYLLPVFFGVPILMFIFFIPSKKNIILNSIAYFGIMFMAYNFVVMLINLDHNKLQSVYYYPEEVSCLDSISKNYDVHNGIAQYWDVKKVNVASKSGVELATVNSQLHYTNWSDTDSYRHPQYDFAFIDLAMSGDYLLDVNLIKQLNGAPVAEIMCANQWLVLIYGKNKLKIK